MSVDLHQILLRITEQGSEYCPICRKGEKHLVNIECVSRFWRYLFPRKFNEEVLSRYCAFFNGTPLMNIYTDKEYGYAVATLHFAFAMITMAQDQRLFWAYIAKFILADHNLRGGDLSRKLWIVLHVIETLAWHSEEGALFPMPVAVWYRQCPILRQTQEFKDVMDSVIVHEYK